MVAHIWSVINLFQKEKTATEFHPQAQKKEEGPKTEKELREAYEKLQTRVAFLEAELIKKDSKIKELENGSSSSSSS